MAESKICKCCLEEKGVFLFYFRKESNKYKNVCKKCTIAGRKIEKSDTHKICKHCGETKPFSEYQKAGSGKWLQPYCKHCDSIRKKQFYEKTKTCGTRKIRTEEEKRILNIKRAKEYASKNSEKLLANKKRYYQDNKERFKEYRIKRRADPNHLRRLSELGKIYREKNVQKIIANKQAYQNCGRATEVAKMWQAKQMDNIEFRLKKNLRGRIYVALKRGVKSEPTMKLLGCTIDKFKEYFESLFTEGMNWDVYKNGGIHIDHIIPCSKFDLTSPEQQRECFHYTNLQPLWRMDNLRKGTSLNYNKKAA